MKAEASNDGEMYPPEHDDPRPYTQSTERSSAFSLFLIYKPFPSWCLIRESKTTVTSLESCAQNQTTKQNKKPSVCFCPLSLEQST